MNRELSSLLGDWSSMGVGASFMFRSKTLDDFKRMCREHMKEIRYAPPMSIYRGFRFSVPKAVKLFRRGKVMLDDNELESWTYAPNVAMGFANMMQSQNPYRIMLSKKKIPKGALVFDYKHAAKQSPNWDKEWIRESEQSVKEMELLTESLCGVCSADDVEIIVVPFLKDSIEDGDVFPGLSSLEDAYPNAKWRDAAADVTADSLSSLIEMLPRHHWTKPTVLLPSNKIIKIGGDFTMDKVTSWSHWLKRKPGKYAPKMTRGG